MVWGGAESKNISSNGIILETLSSGKTAPKMRG